MAKTDILIPEKVRRDSAPVKQLEKGQWYWVKDDGGRWLGCIVHVGSNYVKLEQPSNYRTSIRISFDDFDQKTECRELNPDIVIDKNIEKHRLAVERLLNKIKQLTSHFGVGPVTALPDPTASTSTALVAVRGTQDAKAHKAALIKAKDKTLPDLFKKVEEENKCMAMWMKAKLIPMYSEIDALKSVTKGIENKIFTVELYAGLCEELVEVRSGEPGGTDEKVHLFQRRHYMDEECLVNYEAGGMEFKDIGAFDKWLARDENFQRILPTPKCVVAFQVRRNKKSREIVSLHDFIAVFNLEQNDKSTFLYLRNGDRCYRLSTAIDFGGELFPDPERSYLMSGQLYMKQHSSDIISEQEYRDIEFREKERRELHKQKMIEWQGKPKKDRGLEPWYHGSLHEYELVEPKNLYYDDAMATVAAETLQHNRIAVVLQGLLDRSPAFHPHPPWRIWTPDGFNSGVVLVFDETRGLTSGDPPDFEAYRARLNKSIVVGTNTVGQQIAWECAEAVKENERQSRDYRIRHRIDYHRFKPYGNPGPGNVSKVQFIRESKCTFVWERERLCRKWVLNPDRPGWLKRDDSEAVAKFRCPIKLLLNVDAYTPGDYRRFYVDPRTRQEYLQWAPLLLEAEDFKAKE